MVRKYELKATTAPTAFVKRLEKELDDQQLAPVTSPAGAALVIAGAGSGKTRVVTHRVAYLVEGGIAPENILLATFTNKAAREMLRRAAGLTSRGVAGLWGGTFHHIANMVLRRHAGLLGYRRDFTILDREDAKTVMKAAVADAEVDTRARRFPQPQVLVGIESLRANTETPLEEIVQKRYPFFAELIEPVEEVLSLYRLKKLAQNAMDYDDLLVNWRRVITEFAEVGDLYRRQFRAILVDEYQDTNKLQADIVDELAKGHGHLMVVGDDAQSIYSFRGANFANIIEFPKRYPDCKLYKLEHNYRSTPEILKLANVCISFNRRQFRKVLRATRRPGTTPALVAVSDVSAQARFVAQRVLELRDEGVELSQMAVLYRAHHHAMELQMELIRRDIPFEVRSGLRFFEQRHIKDVVAFLRLAVNGRDELSWLRSLTLVEGIGPVTAAKIWRAVGKEEDPVAAVLSEEAEQLVPPRARREWAAYRKVLEELRLPAVVAAPAEGIMGALDGFYRDYAQAEFPDSSRRIEDIEQLARFAGTYDSTEGFLSDLALLGTVGAETVVLADREEEGLTLSTIHQAKGLEWKAVFLIWLAEGRMPSGRSLEEPEGIEEERRLFYVACTRAKDDLYLTYPMASMDRQRRMVLLDPSRFLKEVPTASYEEWDIRDIGGTAPGALGAQRALGAPGRAREEEDGEG